MTNIENLELNKIYRTRSGKKCRIICVDIKSTMMPSYPVVGLLDVGDHECTIILTLHGKLQAHRENDHDLIAEWTEPKPRRLAWINVDTGRIVLITEKEFEAYSSIFWNRAPWLDEPEEGVK